MTSTGDVDVTRRKHRSMARSAMHLLRAFLARHRALSAMLIAAALCMKALIPAGYMLGNGDRVLTVEICADSQGGHLTKQIVLPGDGKSDGQGEHGKTDGTCAFSALSFASLSAADPVLLALALIFIMALGFAPVAASRAARQSHLRPPLRGPPALV
jgi:hypothetical protein